MMMQLFVKSSGIAIRSAGAALIVLCTACVHELVLRRSAPDSGAAYLFAFLSFATGTLGSALLVLGGHLFDRIEVAERWRRR